MKTEILSEYINCFRELVNNKVQRIICSENNDDDFIKLIQKALKLNKSSDWKFICTAMDIIDDCSLAFKNFLKFGLSGPTKINDDGEKYLRLYGLLSATYIQQQAILNLYSLCQLPNPDLCKKQMENLDIRVVRHQIAAHSNDYLNPETNTMESFVPSRMTIGDFDLEYINNSSSEFNSINLKESLDRHLDLMIDLIDSIYIKLANTLYKRNTEKIDELISCLKYARAKREGDIVINTAIGKKIILKVDRAE